MESSAEEQETSWITSFCQARGNEFFCQVDRNYIEDGFNLYGLKGVVDNFGECLDIILDRAEVADESDAASGGGVASSNLAAAAASGLGDAADLSTQACELSAHTVELYGLIHARYIVTAHGLEAMHAKYARREFGCCPRFYCDNYPVLPLGLNDSVGVEKVVVYCPRCRHVFRTPAAPDSVDGAFFGTTFAHLFLMTFGFPRLPADEPYVPRVFGFRLNRTAVERAANPPQYAMPHAGAPPRGITDHRTSRELVSSIPPADSAERHREPRGDELPPTASSWRQPPAQSATESPRKRPRLDQPTLAPAAQIEPPPPPPPPPPPHRPILPRG